MRAYHVSRTAVGLAALAVPGLVIPQPAAAQFTSDGISLQSWIDLSTFGAGSGNDCWGYTSPSGREYALMGLSNKTAFVEITDPANPIWFASIEHNNSTWSDTTVYRGFAYIVTEAGSGIQVVDMSNIDNSVVTLVRTIMSPSSSHNIALDADSGFLYTCGSSGGSARTVIFDLSDPANPMQVGTWGTYEHDAQIVTYTSGPNAGRQIMFGASEGRGLDIIDVTDKSNVFLISRTPYPNVAYCHQLWTEDLQHLYINDELDSIPRTTVFDISDLANPVFLGDFSSGRPSIDHNLYVRDGYIFEANYRSGLRVFDLNTDPLNPPQVGWFDSFPGSDSPSFDGAWSCYPFFPSGTVIVSDITRGLFVLDVSAAVGCQSDSHCDDGDPCTTDTCDPSRTCVHTTLPPGTVCDDGNVCTFGGECNNAGNCVSTDINTLTCTNDAPCIPGHCDTETGLCVCFPCVSVDEPGRAASTVATNRYLSLTPGNRGLPTALRVTFTDLPAPFEGHIGRSMWVGEPREFCENAGENVPSPTGCGPAPGLADPLFLGAPLECEPTFLDWGSQGTIHVYGEAIVPGAQYVVQSIALGCYNASLSNYSPGLSVGTSILGDTVKDCTTTPCGPPDGNVGIITDCIAVVNKFVNLPGAPIKARVDLEPSMPDRIINITDVLMCISGFTADPFPGLGPPACP